MITRKMYDEFLKQNGSIKIAIAGAGYMALGLVNQINLCGGIEVVAISSKTRAKAENLSSKLKDSNTIIMDNIDELVKSDAQFILDLTGNVEVGARLGVASLENGKHFMASAETDATVGPVLAKIARKKDLIYSNMWGDEPGLIKGLYDYAELLGFEIIAIGKFKGYHNTQANPDTVKPWADKSGQNPFVISSFADGSKMSMEMTVTSNATGFIPDVRGMHLPKGSLEEVADLLKLKSEGGIISQKKVIEVIVGAKPSGGIFIVIRSENPEIMASMNYYKQGEGPNYLLYMPYHMPGIEMIYGVIEMMMLKKSMVEPLDIPVSDVLCLAKRDLTIGDKLGPIGGYDYYGEIESAEIADQLDALPLGMASDAVMLKAIKQGEIITRESVKINNHPVCEILRAEFKNMIKQGRQKEII